MAANYWTSTQHLHWEDPTADTGSWYEQIEAATPRFPLPEARQLNVFLQQQVNKLGKRLNTRQPVLATAVVFIRRFYSKVDFQTTNPYLVVATAFYLACKIEECPQHIKIVVAEARTLWQDLIPSDPAKLGQCEFRLVSEINAQLIIHHPYRALKRFEEQLGLTQDEVTVTWSVINDHYATDLALRYSPDVIASMAIILTLTTRSSHGNNAGRSGAGQGMLSRVGQTGGTAVAQTALTEAMHVKGQKLKDWLGSRDTDVEALIDCTQQMISLYVMMEKYNEKECKEKVLRMIKGKGLESWAG